MARNLAPISLPLLVLGVILGGGGQRLSFRAALGAVNSRTPVDRRREVASSFFVVCYVAISLPVSGKGLLAQLAGLRTAGLVFIAAVVLVLRRPRARW